jgi:hypothetical protein
MIPRSLLALAQAPRQLQRVIPTLPMVAKPATTSKEVLRPPRLPKASTRIRPSLQELLVGVWGSARSSLQPCCSSAAGVQAPPMASNFMRQVRDAKRVRDSGKKKEKTEEKNGTPTSYCVFNVSEGRKKSGKKKNYMKRIAAKRAAQCGATFFFFRSGGRAAAARCFRKKKKEKKKGQVFGFWFFFGF